MSSELKSFRDFARKMAAGDKVRVRRSIFDPLVSFGRTHQIQSAASDRRLWSQLADEIDAHLSRDESNEIDGQEALL